MSKLHTLYSSVTYVFYLSSSLKLSLLVSSYLELFLFLMRDRLSVGLLGALCSFCTRRCGGRFPSHGKDLTAEENDEDKMYRPFGVSHFEYVPSYSAILADRV